MSSLTQQGITALRTGDKRLARQLLKTSISNNPGDVTAYIWLAAAVDNREEAIHYLEEALRLDPTNLSAQKGLSRLKTAASPPSQSSTQARPTINEPISRPISPFTNSNSSRDEFPEWMPKDGQTLSPAEPAPSSSEARSTDPNPEVAKRNLRHGTLVSANQTSTHTPKTNQGAQKRQPSHGILIAVAVVVILGIIACLTALVVFRNLFAPSNQNLLPQQAPPLASQFVIPATATPTIAPSPNPTETPTLTPRPTKTATPTPTFPVLGATIESQMDRIQKEVSDLRGLPITTQIPRYIVSAPNAAQILRNELVDEAFTLKLQKQLRVLSALGLVKPTYDLVNNSLNHLVDGLGGFYEPWSKRLFILGISFRGMEHFVYSHEFDHALVDMNVNMEGLGVGKECVFDQQKCRAIDALIEGDATLLMYQWLKQYASPQDYKDLINYRPPAYALPEQFPPPYASEDAYFPYDYGLTFVQYLYDRGRWAEVNKAYQDLPDSTEQILHPAKYLAHEKPVQLVAPDLKPALGEGWELLESNTMGEWETYLLLGFGADNAAQVEVETAREAAAGWGGDHYQVYYNAVQDVTALAAEWIWDTPKDASQFTKGMRVFLNERFRGASMAHWAGECWQVNNQTTCIYPRNDRLLWIIAPSPELADYILIQYQGYP
jgi:tetratricopeptide (TPR) repeat protein